MIKNGRPYTNECIGIDDHLLTDLPEEVQKAVIEWIDTYFTPRKTINNEYTSYQMKHALQGNTGIYLSDNEFKDAMMICGYKPVKANECHWRFHVSFNKKLIRKMHDQMEPDAKYQKYAEMEHEWRWRK